MRILKYISAISMLAVAGLAQSTPLTWTLEGVTLEDTTAVTGSFTYDADAGLYSNINIIGNGLAFTLLDTQGISSAHSLMAVTQAAGEAASAPLLFVTFNSLTNNGGTRSILNGGIFQCGEDPQNGNTCLFGTGVGQFMVSGRVTTGTGGDDGDTGGGTPIPVPEPTTVGLMLLGLTSICFVRLKRKVVG